ncbi:hypothetical protein KI387_022430, partial [Taxus chinensis]
SNDGSRVWGVGFTTDEGRCGGMCGGRVVGVWDWLEWGRAWERDAGGGCNILAK